MDVSKDWRTARIEAARRGQNPTVLRRLRSGWATNLLGGPSLIHGGENNSIQPGLSATGYIAFDVARNRTTFVRTNGNLLVDDESDKRVGVIRTYR